MPIDGGGDPVPGPVDVDDLAGLRHAVGGGEVHLRGGRLGQGPVLPVPDGLVMGGQPVVQAHLPQGHGAAQAHGGVVDLAVQIVGRLLGGGEEVDEIAPPLQFLRQLFPVYHSHALLCTVRWMVPGLQAVLLVPAESLAQHLVGVAHDDEGPGVDLMDQLLHGDDLPLFEGAHEHQLVLSASPALSVEIGQAPVQLLVDGGGHLPGLAGDDIGHLGGVHPVDHAVHGDGGDVQGDDAVQGAVHAPEGEGHQHDHDQVHGQQQLAHREPGEGDLQQAGDQVRPPGGGPLAQDDAQGQPGDHAAEDRGQHGVHGREGEEIGEQVHQHGGGRHGVQGGDQQMSPQQPPPQQEQGDVGHQDDHTDGQGRDIVVEDLAQGGDPPKADPVGHIEPVKADGVDDRPDGDPEITVERIGNLAFFIRKNWIFM